MLYLAHPTRRINRELEITNRLEGKGYKRKIRKHKQKFFFGRFYSGIRVNKTHIKKAYESKRFDFLVF